MGGKFTSDGVRGHPGRWLSPVRGPLVSRGVGIGRTGVDINAIGHHEGRVETHAELTNDGAAGLRLTLQGVQERLRAAGRAPPLVLLRVHRAKTHA